MTWLAWGFVGLALAGLLPAVMSVVADATVGAWVISLGKLTWGLGGAAAAASVAYSQLMGYSRAAKRGRSVWRCTGRLSSTSTRQDPLLLRSAESCSRWVKRRYGRPVTGW